MAGCSRTKCGNSSDRCGNDVHAWFDCWLEHWRGAILLPPNVHHPLFAHHHCLLFNEKAPKYDGLGGGRCMFAVMKNVIQ